MKKGLTLREKVLLCILAVMLVIMGYYYLFYIPTKDAIAQYEKDFIAIDNEIIQTEAKMIKFANMKAELNAIKEGSSVEVKELPKFDNRQNLMVQLSGILANTDNYSLSFGSVSNDGVTVSRSIDLSYTCGSYEAAKAILEEIYTGEYPCTFTNLFLSNGGKTISVEITYYEYQ